MNKMKKINPQEWYRPKQVAQNGWIKNSKNKGDYYLVLKLIARNKLRARDCGLGKTPYFQIKGSDIMRYVSTMN
jgi:hypothetical protein